MGKNYFTEEGKELNQEEFEFYATWQMNELKKKGYSNDEILRFDDCEIWYEFVSKRIIQ
jgi:hypothetical protein